MSKDSSILTSKYIQAILVGNEEVMEIIKDQKKIFPIQNPAKITFPFITYQRNSIVPTYTKDYMGWVNNVSFEIACVSNDYIQSLELANAVRHAIEWYHWKDKDINITRINIDYITEYSIDLENSTEYVQSITISMDVLPVK